MSGIPAPQPTRHNFAPAPQPRAERRAPPRGPELRVASDARRPGAHTTHTTPAPHTPVARS
eukprot:363499-Chlamydomonas_euryale.AAC.1